MRHIAQCLSLAAILVACNSGKKESNKPQPASTNQGNTATGISNAASANDGLFTGYDGKNDYSILLPSFRTLTIADPSVAKMEQIRVKLSEATITTLLEEAKAKNPNFNDTEFRRKFAREAVVNKVTPLKAGTTVIQTSGGRGGSAGRGQAGWRISKDINLVITEFTASEYNAGKLRYETDGGGKLKACKSCHETGEQGAPPHELGEIMRLSDKDALSWFKTGSAKGRTSKIEHKWDFSSEEEEKGIIAFMRTKQTNDVETLTKLQVEEALANGLLGAGGPTP